MTQDASFGIYFWGVPPLYGGVLYALLPGTSLYGLTLSFAGFLLPLWLPERAAIFR